MPEGEVDGSTLDVRRILETLDRHCVEYLLVGGAGPIADARGVPGADQDSRPVVPLRDMVQQSLRRPERREEFARGLVVAGGRCLKSE